MAPFSTLSLNRSSSDTVTECGRVWLSACGISHRSRWLHVASAHELGHTRPHKESQVRWSLELCSSRPQSTTICRYQPQSVAVARTQLHSAALSRTQLHSAALGRQCCRTDATHRHRDAEPPHGGACGVSRTALVLLSRTHRAAGRRPAPAASCPNAQPPQIRAGRSPAATGQSSSLSYSITRREPHARPSPRPRHNKSWPAKGCGAIRHPARARHLRSQDINQCDCPLLGQLSAALMWLSHSPVATGAQ